MKKEKKKKRRPVRFTGRLNHLISEGEKGESLQFAMKRAGGEFFSWGKRRRKARRKKEPFRNCLGEPSLCAESVVREEERGLSCPKKKKGEVSAAHDGERSRRD